MFGVIYDSFACNSAQSHTEMKKNYTAQLTHALDAMKLPVKGGHARHAVLPGLGA